MMQSKRNNRLIIKVFAIGAAIAALSYLFHPDVGQLSVMINGEPVAEPIVRFAAFPTFLIMMGLAVIFALLMFLGFGIVMMLGASFIAFMACVLLAPYFWPILLIIFLTIALMSFTHDDKI